MFFVFLSFCLFSRNHADQMSERVSSVWSQSLCPNSKVAVTGRYCQKRFFTEIIISGESSFRRRLSCPILSSVCSHHFDTEKSGRKYRQNVFVIMSQTNFYNKFSKYCKNLDHIVWWTKCKTKFWLDKGDQSEQWYWGKNESTLLSWTSTLRPCTEGSHMRLIVATLRIKSLGYE